MKQLSMLRLVVFLPVPPEFLNPTIPVYHYRAVFHGRCQKVFGPSVMPYIRMETTQCIVEDLLAKLMSSFVSARACRSAFMGILHTSACVGSFASPWPFARKSGPCLEHKKAEVQAAQIAYVPETEKNPWKRGWFCLDARYHRIGLLPWAIQADGCDQPVLQFAIREGYHYFVWDSANFSG